MFINSQVGLLSPEKLANYAVLAAGLSNRWVSVCGIIQAIGTVFGGLIGAAVNDALSEKHLAEVATSLVMRLSAAWRGDWPWINYRDFRHNMDDAVNVATMWLAGSTSRADGL